MVNSCKSLEEENIIIMAMLFCLIWCDLLAGKIFSAFMLRYQNIDLKSVSCREGFCVVDFLEGLGPGGTCDDQRTFATFDPPSCFSAPLVFPDNGDTKDDGGDITER